MAVEARLAGEAAASNTAASLSASAWAFFWSGDTVTGLATVPGLVSVCETVTALDMLQDLFGDSHVGQVS